MAKFNLADDDFDILDRPDDLPKPQSIGELYRKKARLTCTQLYDGLLEKGIGTGNNIVGHCKSLGLNRSNKFKIYLANQAFTDIENNIPPHQVNFADGLQKLHDDSTALLADNETAYILIPTTLARTKAQEKEWLSRAHFVLSIAKLTKDKTPQLMVIDSNSFTLPNWLYTDAIRHACQNNQAQVYYHGYFNTGNQSLFDTKACGYNVMQSIQDILEGRFNLEQAFNLLPQQKTAKQIERAGQGISLGVLSTIILVTGAILTGLSPLFPALFLPGIILFALGGTSAFITGGYLGSQWLTSTGKIPYKPLLKMDKEASGFNIQFANNPLAKLGGRQVIADAVQEEIKDRFNKTSTTKDTSPGYNHVVITKLEPDPEIPNNASIGQTFAKKQ